MNIGQIAVGQLGLGTKVDTKKTTDAAGQFETLLIAQMLKSMRESGSGWLGTGDDPAADSSMAMAEEHFAAALTAGGGLGLAHVVQTGLEAPAVAGSVKGVAHREVVPGSSR